MAVLGDEMAEGLRVESGGGEADEEGRVESEDGVVFELDPEPPCEACFVHHGRLFLFFLWGFDLDRVRERERVW